MVGQLIADGESVDLVLVIVTSRLTDLLRLTECHFELGEGPRIFPRVHPDGSVMSGVVDWDPARWGFPDCGVEVPVCCRGVMMGRFVCATRPGVPVDRALRLRATALANQVGRHLVRSCCLQREVSDAGRDRSVDPGGHGRARDLQPDNLAGGVVGHPPFPGQVLDELETPAPFDRGGRVGTTAAIVDFDPHRVGVLRQDEFDGGPGMEDRVGDQLAGE